MDISVSSSASSAPNSSSVLKLLVIASTSVWVCLRIVVGSFHSTSRRKGSMCRTKNLVGTTTCACCNQDYSPQFSRLIEE